MTKAKRYTTEFKAQAINQVVEDGQRTVEVAKRLGISYKSLYLWLRNWRSEQDVKETFDAQEIRREIERLEAKLLTVEGQLSGSDLRPKTNLYERNTKQPHDGSEVVSHRLMFLLNAKTQKREWLGELVLKLPERFHRREKKLARAK